MIFNAKRASSALHARKSLFVFAPDLIASNPVKPCDGGIFRALNLLSKTEQNAARPGQSGGVLRCRSGAGKLLRAYLQTHGAGSGIWREGWALAEVAKRVLKTAPGTFAVFAPDLIAAKPVKPCDGGVFRGLNLLLLLQQNRGTARAGGQALGGGFQSLAAARSRRSRTPSHCMSSGGVSTQMSLTCASSKARSVEKSSRAA